MAAHCMTTITEQWIRDKLHLKHPYLGDVRSLRLPGTYEEKIRHLGIALKSFVRLTTLDLSCNALVSVEGLQHLKMLERLNLYYNHIPSTEEVKVLCKLPALKELDIRLNPFTRSEPHYRLYLIYAMSSLRKLDDCPVRDTERKVAIMQFPCGVLQQSSLPVNLETEPRSRNQRLMSVERLTKRLWHMDVPDDIVLNLVAKSNVGPKTEERTSKTISDNTSTQEMGKSILRFNKTKYVTEKPRVSFGPTVEKRSVTGKQKHKDHAKQMRLQANGHFTPNPSENPQSHSSPFHNIQPPSPPSSAFHLSDPSNPVLHPARISYSGSNQTAGGAAPSPQKTDKHKRGSYRKPLEMLLNLVDKHWAGERSLQQNNNFLSQAVQILSMMEDHLSAQKAEVTTSRREVAALRQGAELREEEHRAEVLALSSQGDEAHMAVGNLQEQLRVVLEENVCLQKQLIKLEQQYLRSLMKVSPIAQIKEAQAEVEELRREIEGLREKVQEAENVKELTNMLQESHRSLVVTNERLLGELNGSLEHG